ncbi:MAG: gliding motility-associated C-terminal domain-containing protein [Bacteroidetes bacterium]|nr:gliding motility-associated C-terminal domain-containing protein [Bacteroidota bacterium]
MKYNRFLLVVLVTLVYSVLPAQDFSNKGKDFWLGYGFHVNMGAGVSASQNNLQDMVLYFTSDKNANVTVDIPGINYKKSYSVAANQVTASDPIPKAGTQDARISGQGTFDRGIHIESDVPIVAYAHIYNASVSGASLLFPTNTLGKEYYSVNFTQSSNASFANSFFFVVATEDNTSVEITPSGPNLNGLASGVASMVTLNKGQVYNVMGTTSGTLGTDLTGSKIRSVSAGGSGGCKKIAVFSGSGKVSIGGAGNASGSADNLFAQAFPAVAWGKKYLTAPTGSQPNNFYRVCVTDPKTVVKLNGVVLPAASLVNKFYYQFKNGNASGTNPAVPNLIEADNPVLVSQYCTTQGQEGNANTTPFGDPEMIYLSPVEQTINQITLYSADKYRILQSYINVIIKNGGTASFTLDGSKVSSFQPHPQEPNYSYAIIPVSAGSHTLYSDTGFNAIAYGFGSAESYGYNAGTNVRDFSSTTIIQNPYGRIDSAVTCVNTPLQLSVPFTFTPASITWDFSAAPNISPNTKIGPITTVVADSTDPAKNLQYYSPGKTFTFTKANTAALRDTIKLYTTSSTPDGCGSTDQVFTIPISVKDLPVAKFSVAAGGCANDPVTLTDQSTATQGTVKRWFWDFGDGTTADLTTATVPPKVYNSPAAYTIKLKAVSDIGCLSVETSQTVQQSSRPVARFATSTLKCIDKDVVFTDGSTTSTGTLAKWTWDLADGKTVIVNSSNAAVTTQYISDGAKAVSLKVATTTGCESDPYTPAFAINPSPQPGFTLPEVCLSDAFALFADTSKISDGSESQFKYLWNFNAGTPAVSPGPNITSSTLKNPQVKYADRGYYKVSLTVTSKDACVASLVQDFTVNGSIPKAAFDFANAAPYCGVKPVKLRNNSTVDFGTVTRLEIYWDFVNAPTVKEVDENPVPGKIYPHSYPDPTAPKTYTIRLVAYSGGNTCVDGSSQTITVYPQPKASFSVSTSQLCYGEIVNFTDKSYAGSSAISRWAWDLAGGTTSSLQNPNKQFNDSGLFTTSLYFFNTDGCISDTAKQSLTVYPNPKLLLPHMITVLSGGQVTLTPTYVFGNELSYLWTPPTYLSSDTAATPKAIPDDDITYQLKLTARGGCSVTDTIFIRVLKGPEVPNAFSPNGDGIHDTWKIKYLDGYPGATIDVYNRYGQVVFRSVGYDKEWDGTRNGNPLPVGTYYYIINPRNGRQIITGSVTLIK